jgi:hypothetical protein
MSDEPIDALIVRVQNELHARLIACGPLMAGDTINAWVVDNCKLYPNLEHVFRAESHSLRVTLLMSTNPPNGINVANNAGPVNVQVGSGNANEMIRGAAPPEIPPPTASGQGHFHIWPAIVAGIAAACIVLLWFIDVPNAVRAALTVGAAVVIVVIVATGYFPFRKKTWEKRCHFGLASLVFLDGFVRNLAAGFLARASQSAEPGSWELQAKVWIGEPDSGIVAALKIAAVVALAFFAFRAKDSA